MRYLLVSFLLFPCMVYSQNHGPSVSFPEELEQPGFISTISRTDDVFISGQPTDSAFLWIKEQGVTTVVNIRTQYEMENYVSFNEKERVEELGMQYIHIPMGREGYPYTPDAVDEFADALNKAEGKTLLHCTVAWRASHLWAAYLIKYKGMTADEAIRHARAIHFGDFPVEELLGKKLIMTLEE